MPDRPPDPDFDAPAILTKAGPGRDPAEAADWCLAWGFVAMFIWWLPVLGQVFPIAGLAAAWRCRDVPGLDRARLGVVLSTIALAMGFATMAYLLMMAQMLADF